MKFSPGVVPQWPKSLDLMWSGLRGSRSSESTEADACDLTLARHLAYSPLTWLPGVYSSVEIAPLTKRSFGVPGTAMALV